MPGFYHTALNDINLSIAAKAKANASFKLATSGWGIGAREDRSLFDRIFDGNITAFSGLDANVGWQPVDEGYKRIVNHEKWVIPWLE